MLYETTIRYLASAFVDAASIVPTPDDIKAAMQMLGPEGFLPISLTQQTPMGPIPRMAFQAGGGEWRALLLADRFDVSRHGMDPAGSNMGTFEEFCTTASPKLAALLKHYGRKGHRLAAVQEGLLSIPAAEGKAEIARKLLRVPPTYGSNPPFEWDWRVASRIARVIAGGAEETNTILTAKRVSGTMEIPPGERRPFDGIRLDIDINTAPENAVSRFGAEELSAFFQEAPLWHSDLSREFQAFVGLEDDHV